MNSNQKFFLDESYYQPKFKETLTKRAALKILNRLSLHCKEDDSLLDELDLLRTYIKNRQL